SSAIEAPSDIARTQEELRKDIAKVRQRNERKLIAAIEKQLPRLARNTEELLSALKPAKDLKVHVGPLLDGVVGKMERMLRSREHGEEHLHDLRKAAKRARYQCESLPGPQAAAMAKRLEELQDAGGPGTTSSTSPPSATKISAPSTHSPACSSTFATSASTF